MKSTAIHYGGDHMLPNKTVLKLNAAFLMLVGSLQMIFELLSHFMGAGPLADRFSDSPYTIGFFEAHGLAILMGILLWRASRHPETFWHQLSLVIHVLLGGANLLFWKSFVQLDFVIPGIVATLFHGVFIFSEAYCASRKQEILPPIPLSSDDIPSPTC